VSLKSWHGTFVARVVSRFRPGIREYVEGIYLIAHSFEDFLNSMRIVSR
jgi:hypothetical protein